MKNLRKNKEKKKNKEQKKKDFCGVSLSFLGFFQKIPFTL